MVENVVKPPQKPMAPNGRTNRVGGQRSTTRVMSTPRSSEPAVLARNVGQGTPRAGGASVRSSP